MKVIAAMVFSVLMCVNACAEDLPCVKSTAADADNSEKISVRVYKITKAEYMAEIQGPQRLIDVGIDSITIYRGTEKNHTLAIPLAFETSDGRFFASFVGYPKELEGLSVGVRYWGNRCNLDIVKSLDITN